VCTAYLASRQISRMSDCSAVVQRLAAAGSVGTPAAPRLRWRREQGTGSAPVEERGASASVTTIHFAISRRSLSCAADSIVRQSVLERLAGVETHRSPS